MIQNLLVKPLALPLVKAVKNNKILNYLIPNLCEDLKQSSANYIEGLLSLDSEFLANTSSPFLYARLQQQIEKLKQGKGEDKLQEQLQLRLSKFKQLCQNEGKSTVMEVEPYVVFAYDYQKRINEDPCGNIIRLARNRFLYRDFTFSHLLKCMWNDTGNVLGFKYLYFSRLQGSVKLMAVVNFQADLQTDRYLVTDINNTLFNPFEQIDRRPAK